MHKQLQLYECPAADDFFWKDTCSILYRGHACNCCFITLMLLQQFVGQVLVELPDAQLSHAKGSKEAWLPSGQTCSTKWY